MPLETDFNVAPFFDDYDPSKNYYRTLYRPSVAVQARELTQTQSMNHFQMESFAGTVYKDGSRIEGCTPTILPNLEYVRVVDSFLNNPTATVLNVKQSYTLVGKFSRVRAQCLVPVEGLLIDPNGKTNRFYIKYIKSELNKPTKFIGDETILIYNENQDSLGQLDPRNLILQINVITGTPTIKATGQGYGFKIENGMIYQKGYFQNVSEQTIVVRDFDQEVGTSLIGFNTIEEIITENDDPTLNDNALGYPNENAPGAWRLRLDPVLVVKEETTITKEDKFFPIFSFSKITKEIVQDRRNDPYSEIGGYLNTRTFEESGNYVVKPFLASATPYLDDSTKFSWQISAGKGYVNGARIEWLSSDAVATSRSFDYKVYKNQVVTANFGSYVFTKEFAGYFDTSSTSSVDIYDTPQNFVSRNNTGLAPGSKKIGTAKIKFYLYDSGLAGTPEAIYKIYITDVNITSGSFASNAKSLVATDVNGTVFFSADIQLNTYGSAVIFQNTSKALIATFGVPSLKTLNSDGSWDTNFNFVGYSDGLLQPNGYISITTNSSWPGGTDILAYGEGKLDDQQEKQIIVSLKDSVYTDFIPAITVTVGDYDTSKNTKYVSVGFNNISNYFTVGEYVRVPDSSDPKILYNERIIRTINSSSVEVTSSGGIKNGINLNVAKYWPAGYEVPLVDNTNTPRFVTVTSTTTFNITSGVGNNDVTLVSSVSTPRVSVKYVMLRTSAQPAKKLARKNIYVKLNLNTHPNGINGPWPLGFIDVFKINAVYANKEQYQISNDVSDMFSFDSGQTDTSYETSQLILKPQYRNALSGTPFVVVKCNVFETDDSSGIGFFSVDSYPTSTDIINIPDDKISWAEIPVYNSGNKTRFDLRDCLDYRSLKQNTGNLATSVETASENPLRSDSFRSNSTRYLIEPDTNVLTDFEAYLGRRDYVGINSQGKMTVINGIAAEDPVVPLYDADFMPIAIGYVPPYPTLTPEEAVKFKRSDYQLKTQSVWNRGYTMRDIGVLDQRIRNLEYYNVLNALEQNAKNLKIKDQQGIDRFKNGIFVDPMNSHAFADANSTEYRWAIDVKKSYGAPMYKSQSIDMGFDMSTSQNMQLTGISLTLPYTHEKIISQPYSTKVRNTTQDYWAFFGELDLYPNFDMNQDVNIAPPQDITIDNFQPIVDLANQVEDATGATVIGTRRGDWNTVSQTRNRVGNVVTVTTEQERNVTDVTATPMSQTQSIDPFVTDIAFQPYIKSRTVAFNAYGLKPNTRIYAFFDDQPVSQYCAPGELNTNLGSNIEEVYQAAYVAGKPETIVNRTAPLGSELVTDSNGELFGVFVIPAGKFLFGDRKLFLSNQDSLVTGTDATITKASAIYTASNISITKRGTNITTLTPQWEQKCSVERKTSQYSYVDPLGQSFRIEAPEEQSGVMITKIDLYFKNKSSKLGISVRICGMMNGVPDPASVFTTSFLPSEKVAVSDDATLATTFILDNPVFLTSNMDYAFYVYPEANNPDYDLWVSEIGGTDVTTKYQINTNPYIGDLFRSSNAKTWVALPREDIKFNIYVANFSMVDGVAQFNNEDDEFIEFDTYTLKSDNKPIQVNDEIRIIRGPDEPVIIDQNQKGTVQGVNITTKSLVVNGSAGNLQVGQYLGIFRTPTSQTNVLTNDNLIATVKIAAIKNPAIHTIVPRFATAIPTGTYLGVSFQGTDEGGIKDVDPIDLNFDTGKELVDRERFVFSKSNEKNLSSKSLSMKCTFKTSNKYISPVIDMSRRNALCIENLLNGRDNLKFEYTRQGTSLAKYVSQKVVLADGQDAEDLKVYVTGYRPGETDISVYVKFLAGDDPDLFDNKVWTKMNNDNESLFCSNIIIDDFKEFVFSVPQRRLSPSQDLPDIQYSAFLDPDNNNFLTYYSKSEASERKSVTFKTFAIKIVTTSENAIWCPKIDDVRALAIQA